MLLAGLFFGFFIFRGFVGRLGFLALRPLIFGRGLCIVAVIVPALWFLIVGYFLVLVGFGVFCGFPAALCLFFLFGCSGCLEFFIGFFQRIFDQADHELLLGKAAVVGFLVVFKVFLYPLEQLLAYLKC